MGLCGDEVCSLPEQWVKATAQIQSLAQELPYAADAAKKKKRIVNFCVKHDSMKLSEDSIEASLQELKLGEKFPDGIKSTIQKR